MSGSFWLFGQILFCLFLAFVTGLILGWLLRRFIGQDGVDGLAIDEHALTADPDRTPELSYAGSGPGFFTSTEVRLTDRAPGDGGGDDAREPILVNRGVHDDRDQTLSIDSRLASLEQENAALRAQVSDYESSTASDAGSDIAESDVMRLQSELALITRERDDQRKHIARLHSELDSNLSNENALQELRSQLNAAVLERDRYQEELAQLAAEQPPVASADAGPRVDDTAGLAHRDAADDELRQELAAKDAQIEQLNVAIEEINQDRNALTSRVNDQASELAEVRASAIDRASADELERQIIEARRNNESQEAAIESMREEVKSLHAERSEMERASLSARREKESLDSELEALKEKIINLTRRAEQSEAALNTEKSELEKKTGQLTTANSKYSELEIQRNELDERYKKLEKEFNKIETRTEDARALERSMKNNIAEITKQRNALQVQADGLQGELIKLKASGVTYNDAADNAKLALAESHKERDRLRKHCDDMEKELAELRGATAARGDISDALRKQLETVRSDNASLDQQLQKQTAIIHRLQRERGGSRGVDIDALAPTPDPGDDEQLALGLSSSADHDGPVAASQQTDASDPESVARGNTVTVSEEDRPSSLATPRQGKADDLKRIKGVGPKIEKTLWSLGVYHFDQIADWSPQTCRWVSQHLEFPGRVERERWIDQARILAGGGETEFSKRYRK